MEHTAHVRLVTRSEISARPFVSVDGIRVFQQRLAILHVLDHGRLLENQPPVIEDYC